MKLTMDILKENCSGKILHSVKNDGSVNFLGKIIYCNGNSMSVDWYISSVPSAKVIDFKGIKLFYSHSVNYDVAGLGTLISINPGIEIGEDTTSGLKILQLIGDPALIENLMQNESLLNELGLTIYKGKI